MVMLNESDTEMMRGLLYKTLHEFQSENVHTHKKQEIACAKRKKRKTLFLSISVYLKLDK